MHLTGGYGAATNALFHPPPLPAKEPFPPLSHQQVTQTVGRTPRSKNVAKFISITKNAEVIYLQETGHRVYFQKGAWLHSENCKQCAAQPALARRRKARVGSGKSKSLGALRG